VTIAPWQHAAALALAAFDVIVRGMRMQLLMPISLGRAVRVNAYGDAAATLTPARLGGELARFLGFRRERIVLEDTLSALGVELVADWVLVLLAGALLAGLYGAHLADYLRRLMMTLASPGLAWLVALAIVLGTAGGVALGRGRWRVPPALRGSLVASLRRARALSAGRLVVVGLLTVASIAARIIILPVLVWGLDRVSFGATLFGSFVLVFGQHVLPSPAGAGGVELGFLAGFGGVMPGADAALLLLSWRWYASLLPAGLGGVLLLVELLRRLAAR
jgi:uncharacterized membrane protein YbhN (UPF0104 family)